MSQANRTTGRLFCILCTPAFSPDRNDVHVRNSNKRKEHFTTPESNRERCLRAMPTASPMLPYAVVLVQ